MDHQPINNVDKQTTPAAPNVTCHGSFSKLHSTSKNENEEVLSLGIALSNQGRGFILSLPTLTTNHPPTPVLFEEIQELDRDIIQSGCEIIPGNLTITEMMARNLLDIAAKGRTQCNSADAIDVIRVVYKLEELYPLVVGVSEVCSVGHDMMDPEKFSESLELVAALLSKRSSEGLNIENVQELERSDDLRAQHIHFPCCGLIILLEAIALYKSLIRARTL